MKRRTFLLISFGLVALFLAWRILAWVEFLIENPSSAIMHNNWIGIIIYCIYFTVSYLLIFAKAWSKTPPAEATWPPARCYGLLLWTLLTVLSSPPLSGPQAVRVHVTMCVAVDILFLIRMIIGRMRNENGWIWQTYAVTYVWLEMFLPDVATGFLF